MKMTACTPEFKVKQSMERLLKEMQLRDFSDEHFLCAVSGGADSVFLLCVLHRLAPLYGYRLSVVTVNHMIRSAEESSGDARFVAELCSSLFPSVSCTIIDLKVGEVSREAEVRGRGIEEAARHLRYRHFDAIAEKTGATRILTAHSRTDQLETILMRFFQGAGGASLGGIAEHRGKYFRPLLGVSRDELVDWLRNENISWREDDTNNDDAFLRNRVRHHLVPALNSFFPGWESGVFTSVSKALLDDDLCKNLVSVQWRPSGTRIECLVDDFVSLHPALRLRFLQNGLSLLSVHHRVPFGLLKRIIDAPEQCGIGEMDNVRICGSRLCFISEGDSFFWGQDIVQNTKSGYLIYINSCGRYCFPFGIITVSGDAKTVFFDGRFGPFSLPLTIRSRMAGDSVKTSDGKQKTLKKIMNDWSIPESDRNMLPLIEKEGSLIAIYGSALGYADWYVKI